jgi:hypothetical protein
MLYVCWFADTMQLAEFFVSCPLWVVQGGGYNVSQIFECPENTSDWIRIRFRLLGTINEASRKSRSSITLPAAVHRASKGLPLCLELIPQGLTMMGVRPAGRCGYFGPTCVMLVDNQFWSGMYCLSPASPYQPTNWVNDRVVIIGGVRHVYSPHRLTALAWSRF